MAINPTAEASADRVRTRPTCVDNPRLGRSGCGATYSGRVQHSVARVPWSTHPDGLAHVTFTGEDASDLCWRGGTMRDPATVRHPKTGELLLEQDERGRWQRRNARRGATWGRQSDVGASE